MGRIGTRHVNNPWIVELVGRLYWFTVEFGLIQQNGKLKIYGAGILSSHGETKFCVSNQPQHFPFSVEKILNTPYRNDCIQDKYFVLESFEQLYDCIPEIEERIEAEAPVDV
jgi:phenylalanine-4-hydroxylase